jgi:uncharacterized protein YndB with AHSA1/START domain
MTERSVVHSSFTIERTYARPPARVFAAWADPALKGRWFGGGTDDAPVDLDMDLRVGAHERDRNEAGYEARYHEIVPDERIVFTYDLTFGGPLVSVSLATVEFHPTGDGGTSTQLTYTEHGAFLDGVDDPELRTNGTGGMLDQLGRLLEREAATAQLGG